LKPLTELGLRDFVFNGWNGMMAPNGTPPAAVARLSAALSGALHPDASVCAFKRHGLQARRRYAGTDAAAD
jgi:tripartite-type tricarboxylate transporter receptor subunit TctC